MTPVELLFDPELDRLILRFEGLLRVSRLLEARGASPAELVEHRRELERVGRELAGFVARADTSRTRRLNGRATLRA